MYMHIDECRHVLLVFYFLLQTFGSCFCISHIEIFLLIFYTDWIRGFVYCINTLGRLSAGLISVTIHGTLSTSLAVCWSGAQSG